MFDDLVARYSDLEAEAAATPADSRTGALAKSACADRRPREAAPTMPTF